MKFLCVPCDTPMKLQTLEPPDRGSLSVVYACPECGYEMAMLTNAYETQVVQSLGVRIGPASAAGVPSALDATSRQAGAALGHSAEPRRSSESEVGCPFAGMVQGAGNERGTTEAPPVRWTAAAEERLLKVPSFVRPMARTGIEKFALDSGAVEVDEEILDAARDFFGM